MMKDEDVRGISELMLMMLSQFQTGFDMLRKQNKDLDNEEILGLTSIWWEGMMHMIGMTMNHPTEGDDLWNM